MKPAIGLRFSIFAVVLGSTIWTPALAVKPQTTAAKSPAGLTNLPTSGLQIPFSTYTNNSLGISFVYPAAWKESKPAEANGVVKFAGTYKDDPGEVTLSKFDPSSDAQTVKNLLDVTIFPKLEDFKKLQEDRVSIGQRRHIPAVLEDVAFTIQGLKVQQRYVFFDLKGTTYSLMFTTPGARFNNLVPVYNHVLLSLRATDSINASTNRALASEKAGAANNKLTAFRSNLTPVIFSYPEDWEVQQTGNKNEPVVIKGKNAQGNYAQINLYRGAMQPGFTIENVADLLEKEYFEPQKDFRRVNRQVQDFGSNSKVSGVIQEQSFDFNGAPMKQMVAMFFQNDHCYALSMYAPGWKENDMRQLFHKVLATVQIQD